MVFGGFVLCVHGVVMDKLPVFNMVLFGGTGDLAMRKLLPALYQAHVRGRLHVQGKIWALGRRDWGRGDYLAQVEAKAKSHLDDGVNEALWHSFCQRLDYIQLDVNHADGFQRLAKALAQHPAEVLVAYWSMTPHHFIAIGQHMAQAGLAGPHVRLVLEKPLGIDLASSNAINEAVLRYFDETQIYRIDHYLGKESVQNLLAIRFANVLFEPLWRRQWISSVQITLAESLGMEGRGAFYDGTGALRDMVQNHLLQLLCMVAMEPPSSLNADAVRDEKIKVLHALKPLSTDDVAKQVVRGQYHGGRIHGQAVCAYADEADVAPGSRTETFVAIRTEIQNWRWAGVPFFLRTGKRMPQKLAEIVIQFSKLPVPLFAHGHAAPNRLVIRLQPEEDIRLYLQAKQPGQDMAVEPTFLNLDFGHGAQVHRSGAYERLLLDVIHGKLALFVRRDEVMAAWQWVAPIMAVWAADDGMPSAYAAGSWGPVVADALLSGRAEHWHEAMG